MNIEFDYTERRYSIGRDPAWRQTLVLVALIPGMPDKGSRIGDCRTCGTWVELTLRTVRDATPCPTAPTAWEIWIDYPFRKRVLFEAIRCPPDGSRDAEALAQVKRVAEDFLRSVFEAELAEETVRALTTLPG